MFSINRRSLLAFVGLAPAAVVAPAKAAGAPRAPIRVLFTRVNGEAYYDARTALASLAEAQPVVLRREADNRFDRRAIEVFAATGAKLGYIARIDNSTVARMMDAGERFEAHIARIDPHRIDIRLVVDWLPG